MRMATYEDEAAGTYGWCPVFEAADVARMSDEELIGGHRMYHGNMDEDFDWECQSNARLIESEIVARAAFEPAKWAAFMEYHSLTVTA